MTEVTDLAAAAVLDGTEILAIGQPLAPFKITSLRLVKEVLALAGQTVAFGNAVTIAGNTTLGDASVDGVTINAATVACPNGLNFDTNTLVVHSSTDGVLIGQTTNANNVRLVIKGSAGTADDLTFNTDATRADIQTFNAKPLSLNRQGNPIHMVSGGSGNVIIGSATAIGARLDVIGAAAAATMAVQVGANGNSGIVFLNAAGSGVGSIVVGAATTTYNTSSDHRLPWKEGHTDLEGSGAFIDALRPRFFPAVGQAGFMAHEFAEVSPSSVSGEKDAEDADGKPIYQAMMAASPDVFAHVIAELQSLRARVAQLEAAT